MLVLWLSEALKVKARVAVIVLVGGFIILLLPERYGAGLLGFAIVRDSAYRWAPGLAILAAAGTLILRSWDKASAAYEEMKSGEEIIFRLSLCSQKERDLLIRAYRKGVDTVVVNRDETVFAMTLEKKGLLRDVHLQDDGGVYVVPVDVWTIMHADLRWLDGGSPRRKVPVSMRSYIYYLKNRKRVRQGSSEAEAIGSEAIGRRRRSQ